MSADLAGDLAAALDPVVLARRMAIVPDLWQARVLRSWARQIILNCSRQVGKSTVTGILAGHTALYTPGAPILLLSPTERQSIELLRKVKETLRQLGTTATEVEKDNALSLEFANGSRILALPGKEGTIRGFSGVRLLIIDEASRVPDALYQAVRPMLAVSGGRIVLLSSPFGKRGFFHHEWTAGGPGWERVEVTAYECPRIAREWLAKERATIGDWWFDQEYLCQFKETTDQVFAYDDVMGAVSADVAPLFALEGSR
jgi:hypothetical protein